MKWDEAKFLKDFFGFTEKEEGKIIK